MPADALQVSSLPPVFFNAIDGILPLVLHGPQNQVLNIYVTHNGGASWSATTSVPTGASAGTTDFTDAAHGWLTGNTFAVKSNQYINSTVYRTSDGGQHWTQYTVRLNADITMVDFVSQTGESTLDLLSACSASPDA